MAVKKIVVTESTEEKSETKTAPAETVRPAAEPGTAEPVPAEPKPDTPKTDVPETAKDTHRSGVSDGGINEPKVLSRLTLPTYPARKLSKGAIKHWRRAVAAVVLLVIVIFVAVAVVHLFAKPAGDPLPKSLQQEVTFTVYYPHSNIAGYKYIAGSGNYAEGKLTYNIGGEGPIIHISEQALAAGAPDLHKLQGFTVFQAPAGPAAVGASGNVLNGILVVPHKTLVILNGLGGVSKQDLAKAINSLGS